MRLKRSKGMSARRGKVGYNKKGGFWGEVVKQAIVPLGLLTLQQNYNKNSYYNNYVKQSLSRTRKRGRRRGSSTYHRNKH